MREPIDRVLEPSSIAVVGASTDPSKRGHQAIETLQNGGYDGTIYPVNPSADEIRGLEVYASIADVPEPVDLALIVVPGPVVPAVLEECGEVDVGGAVVVAVGFGETDDEGEALEEEIVSIARENDVRLVGPNTSGLINVADGANLVGADGVPEGDLGLLCQSGNLAIALFTEAAGREGVGFSHYVGVGNEADLQFDEYLPYFERTDETDAVVCYVEGFSDGRAFLEQAHETTRETPIVVCKSGRSDVGKRSASSHTGSLAGDAAVADAVFRQAGVVSVDRSDELLATADALASQPPIDGENVAILADGGGHATLAADALADRGLSVPPLADETQRRLEDVLPDAASVRNPVDVAGGTDDDPSVFADCAAALFDDPNVDAVLLSGLFGGYGERFTDDLEPIERTAARDIADAAAATDTPLVVQSAYESADPDPHAILRENEVPVYESLDIAVACLSALSEYGTHLQVADEKSSFELDRASGDERGGIRSLSADASGRTFSEYDAKELLKEYGAPVTPYSLVESADAAERAAAEFDGPVAMKVVSPDLIHKTEADAVALDVADEAVGSTYETLLENARAYAPDAAIDGVLVSPMRTDGVEVIVGATRDEQFGPVVMFGLGGVFVEVLEDVTFRAAPLSERDARAMIDEIDAQAILDGARGDPPVDRDALVDVLRSVSRLVADNSDVSEVDLNPVLAGEDGAEILDASIVLEAAAEGGDDGRRREEPDAVADGGDGGVDE
ncbi:acetate--CoA ligase family protein [Natronolimnohabitans sp. A-GB9]|uniref:acetate--CoA ligase family protein n=1 Tax=Natronolimnohabitans sp. A-GB9 TaxID=3069757 RepID=UPI0027B5910F|nr:acetate--CoA ligase [Natronolimnohabitans sp. A-GB9]MDQ2050870.1 acetate--CoA ligase family protein [Natronolimnohabitans sp. A-GB9]